MDDVRCAPLGCLFALRSRLLRCCSRTIESEQKERYAMNRMKHTEVIQETVDR